MIFLLHGRLLWDKQRGSLPGITLLNAIFSNIGKVFMYTELLNCYRYPDVRCLIKRIYMVESDNKGRRVAGLGRLSRKESSTG